MSAKGLIIIFVKNNVPGNAKTRLASSIGEQGAYEVYTELIRITEEESLKVQGVDLHIYFTDEIEEVHWPTNDKFLQIGNDLGERMKNAFIAGFVAGYDHIIGIGSDLPDIKADLLKGALDALERKETVFGPAADGGYYLLGMNQLFDCVFTNKPWSTKRLLEETLNELRSKDNSFELLKELNDIDTLDDLKMSSLSQKMSHLYELSGSNK